MAEFVSEPLTPKPGTFNAARMAAGEPGLPTGFTWRGEDFDVAEVVEAWKHSSRAGGRAGGQLYLRRHYYRLRMINGQVWTVYFVRQTPTSGSAKARWFLYAVG